MMRGFSLIELMIAVAIVAIVAAVALPAYQDQIRKGRRSDGTTLLMEMHQLEERFYTENNTFTTILSDLGYTGSSGSLESPEEHYLARVETSGGCVLPNCYLLLAQPVTESQADDGDLRIWSDGRKERKVDGVWQAGWD